jgi:predicted metal-dependent peptidase
MTDGLDRTKLAAARLWAATRFPYLASALFASPAVAQPGSGTVAVDEQWRLYVDPYVVADWSVEELGVTLVHHAGHLLRDHAARARDMRLASDDDAAAWVSAADAEINDDLADAGLPLGGRDVLPRDLGCDAGRLAEEYFEAARATAPEHDDCGSGADGRTRDWDHGEGGLSPYSSDLLRSQVASDIRQHGKEAGDIPAGLLRWADSVLTAKVDWRKMLAAEIRRGVAGITGAVDYTYRRPSRRAAAGGDVVLPSLRRPTPEVAVVCDTSASMTPDLLERVLAEVDGVLRGVGLRGNGVRVLACDTAVHSARRITSSRHIELVGGGGTDMGAGIEAAARGRPRPDLIVVLTDGYTPWPPQAPRGIKVIVGLLDGGTAPRWARTVQIDEVAVPRR